MEGIAASVARDTELASHPDVIVYHPFESKEQIRNSFIGISEPPGGGRPYLDTDAELYDVLEYGVRAVRLAALFTTGSPPNQANGNERIASWYCTAEPVLAGARFRPWQRPYGESYTHCFVRYLLWLDPDVMLNAGIFGGKYPGMVGSANISAQGIDAPAPPVNAFATWECRKFFGNYNGESFQLGEYYYGTRAPRFYVGLDGKPTTQWRPGAGYWPELGVPSTPGKYYGQGTNGGNLLSTGRVYAGRWHCIEQEVKLNTVRDSTLKAPKSSDPNEQMQEMLDNANDDGELRGWLDGELVYENVHVAFRSLDSVRIQSIPWVNIYYGGQGNRETGAGYPQGPMHHSLAALVAARSYIGPPRKLLTNPEGGSMPIITLTVPTGTQVNTEETPDGKPVGGVDPAVLAQAQSDLAAAKTSLAAMTTNRDEWKTFAETIQAKAADAGDDPKPKVV